MNKKKVVFDVGIFISIYKINRTFHGHLGIRTESIFHSFASLTRERYFQHSKIKFVFPRGHVISSISILDKKKRLGIFTTNGVKFGTIITDV